MTDPTISATVQGGTVMGVVGARTVVIENFYAGSAPLPAAPPEQTTDAELPPCPYPGLSSFGPGDRALFYGRETAIVRLLEAVPAKGLTALVGASGTGKSSVVLAGLAPRLADSGGWRFSHFRVGTEVDKSPFAAMARALVPLFADDLGQIDRLQEVGKLAAKLQSGDISLQTILGECRSRNSGRRILLIADQCEEIFTLIPDEATRNRFIDVLLSGFSGVQVAGAAPDVCLIMTLRADFYGMAMRHRPLSDALQGHVENLGPMTRDELRDAIVRPAGAVSFESGLVDTLLDDVTSRPGNLPLLQFALREMWFRQQRGCITHEAYQAIGRVEGALAKRAQEIFDAVTKNGGDTDAVALFRRLFTRLVTLGEGVEDTRRVVDRDELGDAAWALAQRLAGEDNRLLVTSAAAPGHETAEVVHEALIRNWPALIDWINRDRAFQSFLRQLRPRLEEWRAHPEDEGALLRGGPLAAAEDWLNRRRDDLSPEERAFLEASLGARDARRRKEEEARQQELKQQQDLAEAAGKLATEQRRRSRYALAAAAVALCAAIGVGYFAYEAQQAKEEAQYLARLSKEQAVVAGQLSDEALRQAKIAEKQTAEAELQRNEALRQAKIAGEKTEEAESALAEALTTQSRFLADQARQLSTRGDHGTAIALLLPTLDTAPGAIPRPYVPQAEAALLEAVRSLRERRALAGHQGDVNSAVFSSDGSKVLTASDDRTARLWDAGTGKELRKLEQPANPELAASMEHLADLDDVAIGMTFAAFSPDGTKILTTSDDQTARIWNAETGTKLLDIPGTPEFVNFAAFSPDGTKLVLRSENAAQIRDAETGEPFLVTALQPDETIQFAAFARTGNKMVLVALNSNSVQTIRFADTVTGEVLRPLRGNETAVSFVAFAPDGTKIVTAEYGPARVWEIATGAAVAELSGHGRPVSAVFSPDGTKVVTVAAPLYLDESTDDLNSAAVFDIATGVLLFRLQHDGEVTTATFSPDGKMIVTAAEDQTARVWDAATGNELAELGGHAAGLTAAMFSRDGSVLTAAQDNTARIWNTAPMAAPRWLPGTGTGTTANVGGASAFSPDGTQFATVMEGTVRIWDAATAALLEELPKQQDDVDIVAFSPGGTKLFTGPYFAGTAQIWDTASWTKVADAPREEPSSESSPFPGRRINIVANELRSVGVFGPAIDPAAASLPEPAEEHELAYIASAVAAVSPDGTKIVLPLPSDPKTAAIWDSVGKEVASLMGHVEDLNSAAFSPDGTKVFTASADGTARIWNSATGDRLAVLPRTGNPPGLPGMTVMDTVSSPDGTRLLTASNDGNARIWDAAAGNQLAILPHQDLVTAAVFSPNGERVVTISDGQKAWLWDAATGHRLAPLEGTICGYSVAFSADSEQVALCSDEGFRIWRIFATTQNLVDYARSVQPRELTEDQRKEFFLDLPDTAADAPNASAASENAPTTELPRAE